jgi:predicted DNA-binding ribbon-helix-helix protein
MYSSWHSQHRQFFTIVIDNPYRSEKRSITIGRRSTTIHMERLYWAMLERLAKNDRVNWRALAQTILYRKPDWYSSRAGWLRIYVAGYAYGLLTRPHDYSPPKAGMEWDDERHVFRFPRKSRWPWKE